MRTLLDNDQDFTFFGDEQVKIVFLQVVSMLNLESTVYTVSTIRENMDEVLREQGSGTLPPTYLYIMKIHVNSGYESDGLSLVAMLICMCLNLLFTFFWSICREVMLSSVMLLLWKFFNLLSNVINNSSVMWQSFCYSVIEGCRECLHCDFQQECDTQLLAPWVCILEKNCIFPGKFLEFCIKTAWPPCLIKYISDKSDKIRKLKSQKARESQGILLKKNWLETLSVTSFCNFGMNLHG